MFNIFAAMGYNFSIPSLAHELDDWNVCLWTIVLVLAIAALIKYLVKKSGLFLETVI